MNAGQEEESLDDVRPAAEQDARSPEQDGVAASGNFSTKAAQGLSEDFSPEDWKAYLEEVRQCMPVEHVIVDLAAGRAYDWETYRFDVHRDLSKMPNLWYALAARLDPHPESRKNGIGKEARNKDDKVPWQTYWAWLVEDRRSRRRHPEAGSKRLLNAQYYGYLAEFMPASATADPRRCLVAFGACVRAEASALTMAYIRADEVVKDRLDRVGVVMRLGLGRQPAMREVDVNRRFLDRRGKLLQQEDAAEYDRHWKEAMMESWYDPVFSKRHSNSDSDMSLSDVLVESISPTTEFERVRPVSEDARKVYWTLIDQLLWFPSDPNAINVKRSLKELAEKKEPKARKRRTTVIHRYGHVGAVLRMTERLQDYELWATRAQGVVDYIELFEMDINFQHQEPESDDDDDDEDSRFRGMSDSEDRPIETIMTHTSNVPAIVVAFMEHGAKPPEVVDEENQSLAELAKNQQNIHASGHTAALVTLSDAAECFLRARGVEVAVVANGMKALFLVHQFLRLKHPEADAEFLILKALCQAAHQYSANKQTCDPVLLVVNVLSGRVTEEDIEEAEREKASDKLTDANASTPHKFLSQLEQLHGTKTWHILEEGQRRLLLLPEDDRKLLPILFDKIVNLDAVEYATNRLRGLFVKQIMSDMQETVDAKYPDGLEELPNMPRDVNELLTQVYEIAERFTKLFLAGEHMEEAFSPFVSKTVGKKGPSGAGGEKADADRAGGGGESSGKRRKR
eukprot:g13013.t1